MDKDISQLRRSYHKDGLRRNDLPAEPIELFDKWFGDAQESGVIEPNAMSLATVDADTVVSQRTVLLKAYDQQGFVFFTNFESDKAKDIAANSNVSLLLPWLLLERQVIVRGQATKISTTESAKYFASRPKGSQLGAWVSNQSSVITSRQFLMGKLDEIKRKFQEGKIPLPSFWGGYRIEPQTIDFWQGGDDRLHDRFRYTRQADNSWEITRRSP